MKFMQLKLPEWPRGLYKEVCVLRPTVEEWTIKYGVQFEKGHDDLDDFTAAVIISKNGTKFALKKYNHPNQMGFALLLMGNTEDQFTGFPGKELQEFLDLFELTKSHLSWINPDAYEIKY